jgi:hypothetical protein
VIFTPNYFIFANVFLRVGIPHGCVGAFCKKDGVIQVFAGLTPSTQRVESFLRISDHQSQLEKLLNCISTKYNLGIFFRYKK